MPALGLIKWRDSDQSVHANFASQQSEGRFAIDSECRRLDARLFTGLVIVKNRLKSLALSPTQIHTHEHLGPVLRLGPSRSWMNRYDCLACLFIAGVQSLG